MNLPFKMRTETPMEKYRAETFWIKEPETIEWIKSFDPHGVFFDVGANVGVYSLYAASLWPEMEILAFEPMPVTFSALRHNIRLNKYQIIPFQEAVGAFDDSVILEVPDWSSGTTGAQIKHEGSDVKHEGSDGITVEMVSIDAVSDGIIPTHIKIDIDGQELQVVLGMRQTLPHIKSALVEVSSKSKADIVGIMTAAGFSTDNRFNSFKPHSSDRRRAEGIDAENIVFTR